jgi:acyl-CoA hydrolase
MVAVDEHGGPVRDIPKLNYDTPLGAEVKALAGHRRAQIAERRQALEWVNAGDHLRVDDVMEPFRPERYEFLTPEQTQVQVRRQIAPTAFQDDFRIKGGEFLSWLDEVASYTARRFAHNDNVITISVNDILFQHPLHVDDRIELSARVVYVRTHTLEVCIDITVDGRDGTTQQMDSIDFFIFNFDESGLKKKINSGLVLDEPDQDSLRRYMLARTRYNFWKSNPESHLTQSPE